MHYSISVRLSEIFSFLHFVSETKNSTGNNVSADSSDIFYGKFMTYIVMGSLLILANTPIFVNLLRHRMLRAKKEYLLFAGLACADMLAGWGTLIAGVYRMNLIESHKATEQVGFWHCIGTPSFILLTFSMTLQAGMLLVISVDRFIAVTQPLKYVEYTRRYAVGMVAACYVLTASYTAILIVYAYIVDTTTHTVNAVCIIGEVDGLFKSIFYARLCLSSLSVSVYAVVWWLFRRYRNITVSTFSTIKTDLSRAQRRLTATVGICALFTFVFYIIPTMLMFTGLNGYIWAPIYWAVNCLNAVVNVFVYSLRHEDIRRGLKLLFICQELPPQPAKRVHRESTQSFSVTAKAAMIVMEHMGIVASNPIFLQVLSEVK